MSIMTSHEEFCRQLKTAVLNYTDHELQKYLLEAEARRECTEYAEIYKTEIENRKLRS